MCPQKRHCFFFFLLNKIKCLRWWVSNSHLSKSTGGFKVLFFFFSIFKKKFPVFAFLYFSLIETPPTFKSAELLQTILDWIRLPLIIVKKLMNSTWSKYLGRTRKKEKDWGKKWRLLQFGGRKTIMVFFTSLRPNARRKRERREKKEFPHTIRVGCLQSFFFFWNIF